MNLHSLKTEFAQIEQSVTEIHNRALTDNRDLTPEEDAQVTELLNRADELKPQLEKAVADSKKVADLTRASAMFNGIPSPTPTKEVEKPSAKQFVWNFARSRVGLDDGTFTRSLAVADSSVSPGQLPYTIQGDIIKLGYVGRATINSLRNFPMPAGADFKRRVFTSGAVVAAQGSENTEIASGYPAVAYVTVDHATYAGGVRLTLQSLYQTEPGMQELFMQDIAEQYAIKTNTVVAAALKTAASTVVPCPVSGATPQRVMSAIMTAADTVFAASGTEADTIWCSVAVKSWLATLVDTNGQFAFPMIGASNRDGSTGQVGSLNSGLSIGGLRLVVDPHFASETFIVGASQYGEVYESEYPTLQTWVPSTGALEIGVFGELGTYFRSEGFVELVDTDGNTSATPNFG